MANIDNKEITAIKNKFLAIKTKQDLIDVLNYAGTVVYQEKFIPIGLSQLTYHANPKLCSDRYKSFTIKKKSGAERTIHAPVPILKHILRILNFVLQCVFEPKSCVTGFVPARSIFDNAQIHVKNMYVLNIDLKDFFHSFDRSRVKKGFESAPFGFSEDREEIAFLLACLCTHPLELEETVKIVLPQGSPTSPTITNILCQSLDKKLSGLARRFDAHYSRYADDITFSSNRNIFNTDVFQNELKRIIENSQKLKINPDKTRMQKSSFRQEATGLTINEKVNVQKRYIKQVRMWLYYWEHYGYEKAQGYFIEKYRQDLGYKKSGQAQLSNVLKGKLNYLKMIKGENDSTYLKLYERYCILNKLPIKTKQAHSLESILHEFVNKGLKQAMDSYRDFKHYARK